MLPAQMVPPDKVPARAVFAVKGSNERVSGPFDFDGEVEVLIDHSALGDLILHAMVNRGRVAKKGPVTVRFRGAAGRRISTPTPAPAKQEE